MISLPFSRCQHKIIMSLSNNCQLNLAKELDLLLNPKETQDILFLWRNSPVVVIGKHQNPFKECNMQYMKQNNIMLARRPTGGGAVYQDLGNTCWTFISSKFNPSFNNDILVRALSHFGISSKFTGRNDIEVNGVKISGSAFRKIPGRSIHHGTLLIDVDMNNLTSVLNVRDLKLKSKGIKSVRSHVMNLRQISKEIDHNSFCQAMVEEYKAKYHLGSSMHIEFLSENILKKQKSVFERFIELSSQKWLYGNMSDTKIIASKRFEWGLFDVSFEIINETSDLIKKINVHSDCLDNNLVSLFEDFLNHRVDQKQFFNKAENKKFALELISWTRSIETKYGIKKL